MSEAGYGGCFGGATRYPTVTPKEVEAAQPEVVLLPDEPYPFSAEDLEESSTLSTPPRTVYTSWTVTANLIRSPDCEQRRATLGADWIVRSKGTLMELLRLYPEGFITRGPVTLTGGEA